MKDNNIIIENFGIIGELDNEPIHYKEGTKFGNYLRYKDINFSIHYKFNPLTLNKAIKIINYKLEKLKNNVSLDSK
jgi:hypothetical protein